MNPGIYCIINLENKKRYIGQTTNVESRRYSHFGMLRRGKHKNRHLQAAFDKYGEQSFHYGVVESCSISRLDKSERFWIAHYGTTDMKFGYNNEPGGLTRPMASGRTRKRMQIAQCRRRLQDKKDAPERN